MARHLGILVTIFMLYVTAGCSTFQKPSPYEGNEQFSVRLLGNDHVVLKYGVIASDGLRIINDDNLESYQVNSLNIKIIRDDSVLTSFKNDGYLFSGDFRTFMRTKANAGDVFRFEDIRAPIGEEIFLNMSRIIKFKALPKDGSLILN